MISLGARTPGSTPAAAHSGVLGRLEAVLGLTVAGLGVLVFAVAGWVAARLLGGRALYLLVYVGLVLLGVAWALARRARPVAAGRSTLPLRMREGQVTTAEVTVSARRRLSAFIVEEHLDDALGADVRIPVGVVAPGREVRHQYAIRPRRRGVYAVGPLEAEWTDPFGLARSRQRLLEPTEILVHPSTEIVVDRPTARKWEDPPLRPPHSRAWPTGFEFYGVRDYVVGDDLRRVVWRSSARAGRLLVREYEQGITDRIVLLLDTDRSWHRPGAVSDTFETAVRCAASLGARHLADGFSVTIETNAGTLVRDVRGPRARIPMLDELARVERGPERLGDAVGRVLRLRRGVAHHVVVTPHLDDEAAGRLRLLVERGGSVLVAAVAWEEFDALTVRRAVELGAQVVEVRTGQALATVFAHAVSGRAR